MRTTYREMHRHLMDAVGETEYITQHKPTFDKNMLSMKSYIKLGKKTKGEIRNTQSSAENQGRQVQAAKDEEIARQKHSTSQFLLTEINSVADFVDSDRRDSAHRHRLFSTLFYTTPLNQISEKSSF